MRTNIRLPDDHQVWLDVVQGVALDWSEIPSTTYVTDERHSVCQFENSRTLDAAHKEVWIHREDGQNSAYDLQICPIDYRAGDSLALIFAGTQNIEAGTILGVLNSTTGKFSLNESDDREKLKLLGLGTPLKPLKRLFFQGLFLGWAFGITLNAGLQLPFAYLGLSMLIGTLGALMLALAQIASNKRKRRQRIGDLNFRALTILISQAR